MSVDLAGATSDHALPDHRSFKTLAIRQTRLPGLSLKTAGASDGNVRAAVNSDDRFLVRNDALNCDWDTATGVLPRLSSSNLTTRGSALSDGTETETMCMSSSPGYCEAGPAPILSCDARASLKLIVTVYSRFDAGGSFEPLLP